MIEPASYKEAAEALRKAAEGGKRVRFRGGGTKLGWGTPVPEPDVEISTAKLDKIVEHNAGDLTAVVQAGVRLADLQAKLAEHGQMLALDPPLGEGDAATIGGVLATGDSGPLRHRYGGPRDLVLGMTVALSDGTIARSGGKVIKNVAGYDLAKLFTGSFGTLGMILEVAVRLHPLPKATASVAAFADAPKLAAAASALAHSPLEAQCLDVQYGPPAMLVRFAGAAASGQAAMAAELLEESGVSAEAGGDDPRPWEGARRVQLPSGDALVVRVSGTQDQLGRQLGVAERLGGLMVARPAHGLAWFAVPDGDATAVEEIRRALEPSPCVVQAAPREVREQVDVWGVPDGPAVELMRRVKRRFDPANACNPGVFVGGI